MARDTKEVHAEVAVNDHIAIPAVITKHNESSKWTLIVRGLTGSISASSSIDLLVDSLVERGWNTIHFDYSGALDPNKGSPLRTTQTMIRDMQAILNYMKTVNGRLPDMVLARGFGSRISLEALCGSSEIPLLMWAPIVWLRTSLEMRGRFHEFRRHKQLTFDDTAVGGAFLEQLKDPDDEDIIGWIAAHRRHIIVQGKEDAVVSVDLTQQLVRLIENAGGEIALHLVSGEHPHPNSDLNDQITVMCSLLDQLTLDATSTDKKDL